MSLQIVQEVRAKYPTPLGAQHGLFLLEVAGRLGKGLLKKNGGSFITLPDGTRVSQDCVMQPNGKHWDILFDGENAAQPRYDLLTNPDGTPFLTDPANYYAVADVPAPAPVPDPVPVPPAPVPPPAAGIFEVLGAIADLHTEITSHIDRVGGELNEIKAQNAASFSEVFDLLEEIKDRQGKTFYKTRLFGANVTLNPEIR